MGYLHYGAARHQIEFDDRVLAHLQIVIAAKLRRGESMMLSWEHGVQNGSGRSMIWINAGTDLHFEFAGNRMPSINPAWINELAALGYSAHGLVVTSEGQLKPLDSPGF